MVYKPMTLAQKTGGRAAAVKPKVVGSNPTLPTFKEGEKNV